MFFDKLWVFIFVGSFLVLSVDSQNPIKHGKQKWQHPNKMFDTNFDDYCTCDFSKKLAKEKAGDVGNQDIPIYYKRLVKSLFNPQQFKHDPSSAYMIRNVPLMATEDQLMDLEDAKDIRQMDSIVAKIISQSKERKNLEMSLRIVAEAFYQEKLDQILRNINYILIASISLIAFYFLYKFEFFVKNKPKSLLYASLVLLLVFFIAAIVAISWGMAWWQCNEELALANMIKIQMREKKPCVFNSVNSLKRFFFYSNPEVEYEKCMKEAYAPLQKYCDPLHVSVLWLANMKMTYFEALLGSVMRMTSKFTSTSSYISQMIMWPVLFAITLIALGFCVKWFISGGFRFLVALWKHDSRTEESNGQIQAPVINIRLDSKNLKLKSSKALKKIKHVETAVEHLPADSGHFDDSKPIEEETEKSESSASEYEEVPEKKEPIMLEIKEKQRKISGKEQV